MRCEPPRCYAHHIVKPSAPHSPSEDQRIGFSLAGVPILCGRASYLQNRASSWRIVQKKPIVPPASIMTPPRVSPPDRGYGEDRTSPKRRSKKFGYGVELCPSPMILGALDPAREYFPTNLR